jgi:peptidoglycan/xylan/chitin deacetylase (PgdA/CDA1 family)
LYRVPFRWPDGAFLAVAFDVAWEAFPQDVGTPTSTQHGVRRPFQNASRRPLSYDRDMGIVYERAFAERGGIQRLLDVFERQGMKFTALACGEAVDNFPELARAMAEQGHDMSSENWNHEYSVLQSQDEERAEIERTVDAFVRALGAPPSGYTCPGSLSTPGTYEMVAENGYLSVGDFTHTEVPFVMPIGDRSLVCIPHCIHHDYLSWTPRQVFEMWRDDFDALYDEGKRGYPKLLSYGFHPYLFRGFRARVVEEMIAYAKRHSNIWFARRVDIANWVNAEFPTTSVDDFYPESAQSTSIYRLHAPAVAAG